MTTHYFTTPSGPERRRTVPVTIWGTELDLSTAAGTFSSDGLDPGTRVLVRSATPDPAARRVLDLGCGWGPIAVGLARALPSARVDAVDVNERALALTRDNAAAAGVADRVHVALPVGLEVPADGYDEIWSNPPIRIGKPALHALLLDWLPRLAPHGRALLVVARNLGSDSLQRWLVEQGWPTERLTSAKGFRVLQTRRGDAG